jgi:hypothetical protein
MREVQIQIPFRILYSVSGKKTVLHFTLLPTRVYTQSRKSAYWLRNIRRVPQSVRTYQRGPYWTNSVKYDTGKFLKKTLKKLQTWLQSDKIPGIYTKTSVGFIVVGEIQLP